MRAPALSRLAFLLFLAGCMPLPQMELQPSRVAFHANYNAGDPYVLFVVGNEDRPKNYMIIPGRSYALDPAGIRHPIRIQPHAYDLSEHFPFIRDEIFVLNSETDPRPVSYRSGTWSFILTRRVASTTRQDTFSFRLWRFYYNPILHGPPN